MRTLTMHMDSRVNHTAVERNRNHVEPTSHEMTHCVGVLNEEAYPYIH
jgi:hypothetical protein